MSSNNSIHSNIQSVIELSIRNKTPSVETTVNVEDQIEENLMTLNNPKRNKYRYLVCLAWSFAVGFSDGTPGAILPFIEKYYDIGYSIVSLIWIGGAVGFILVASFSDRIHSLLGKHKSYIFGCGCSTLSHAITSSGTKFPVIVFAFFLNGVGAAVNLAQSNVFVTKLDKPSTYLGILHGFYGAGATVGPIISTSIINRGISWHYFYLILVALQLFSTIGFGIVFRGADEDLKPWDQSPDVNNDDDQHLLKLALKNKATWLIALFALFYQGGEVSLGGWMVTFLLDYRNGKIASIGYVASGYWAGLTLGRFLLTTLIYQKMHARGGILFLSTASIVMIILSWTIPSAIASGTVISICGIFLGPIYSILIAFSVRVLPKKIQVVAITIMSAFGSSGGALFPFFTGLIAEFSGTFVVLPISICLLVFMVTSWLLLPNIERKGLRVHWWQHII